MCSTIKENGILVNYDYIGRTVITSIQQWYYINRARSLPDPIKKSPCQTSSADNDNGGSDGGNPFRIDY
jgi:hypothetical protein